MFVAMIEETNVIGGKLKVRKFSACKQLTSSHTFFYKNQSILGLRLAVLKFSRILNSFVLHFIGE